jgi:hypothetical protein
VTGGLDGLLAGVHRHHALRIDEGDLAHFGMRVSRHQRAERLLGGSARAHQLQTEGAVGGLDEGLGGDGADAGFGPGDNGADAEPVGLHRDAELTGGGIASHDRVGVHRPLGGRRSCRPGGSRGDHTSQKQNSYHVYHLTQVL